MITHTVTHAVTQGTPEWHALRAAHYTASEAPAMMGASKHQTRTDLLNSKKYGVTRDIDPATQRRFDAGHQAEADFRPHAEALIGAELYPATLTAEIDGLPLLASLDGLDMAGTMVFEHKAYNQRLAEDATVGDLGPHYYWQLEQQLLVTGADRALFVTSNGTPAQMARCWYTSVPERRTALIAGWRQFAADLASFAPTEAVAAPIAAPIADLPALMVEITGAVTASNLPQWREVVAARIAAIRTDLQDDQDFADAEKTVKFLADGEARIELVKAQAQAQAISIDEIFRALDDIKATMRAKRLDLDKRVKARKEAVRAEIIAARTAAYQTHWTALIERMGLSLAWPAADFAGAIKGKKTIASLHDACDAELARVKIAASTLADHAQAGLKRITEAGHASLFPDRAALCIKDHDDLAAIIQTRIAQHEAALAAAVQKAAEDTAKLAAEAERTKARAEAEAQALAVTAQAVTAQAVIAHQDEIATFMAARDWGKDANKIRAVLVEFVKWQATRGAA